MDQRLVVIVHADDVSDQSFFSEFSFDIELTLEPGNRAFFGQNVLQGLVDGIDDFVHERQSRWKSRTHRIGAPVLLGCSPWVGDRVLLTAIEKLPGACIVLTKARRTTAEERTVSWLRQVNKRTSGIELRALSALGDMAPNVHGQPRVVGPYDTLDDGFSLSTFRTIGYRKTGDVLPPIAHAKLALLGNICWTDEHPSGYVDDYVWLAPRRLWVSSANFTYASRRSAEFGYWTEDLDLVGGVARFLVRLIGASEDLDSTADTPDPELARVAFDDEAMAAVAAESYQERVEEAELRSEEYDDEDW